MFDLNTCIDYHLYVMIKDMCSKCFRSLGVPSRMKMYIYLQNNNIATVSQIVEVVALKQPTVSYHLKEMENTGLLISKKVGKEVYYQIGGQCPICILSSA